MTKEALIKQGSLSALEALYDAPDREKHDETMRNN